MSRLSRARTRARRRLALTRSSRAGIARVVSALEDPNPEVAGQGHARLREKGIVVDVGLKAEEARRAHLGHITRITQDRPHVTLKLAISSDGKAGLAGRKQAAITGDAARERVFQMRAASDAILVGIGTVLADNPQLTCRLPGMFGRSPVRVVLDAQLRVPLSTSVVATVRETPTWIFASPGHRRIAEEILQQKGCKVFRVDEGDGQLDVRQVMKMLAEQGITPADGRRWPDRGGKFCCGGSGGRSCPVSCDKSPSAQAASIRSKVCRLMRLTRQPHALGSEKTRCRYDRKLRALMFTGIVTDMGEVRSGQAAR